MNVLQAIILGAVEGLTEFLPISSTGHLIVAQKMMGLGEINEFFTVVVQSGAILAAIVYFRHRIKEVFTTKRYLLKRILIGIIPTLAVAFLLRKQLNSFDNSLPLLIASTIIFGIVFYIVEIFAMNNQPKKTAEQVTLVDTLIIGLCQSVALIPGTSRSGATIAGGLYRNLQLKEAIDLSFLMGIPVLLIATGYKIVTLKTLDKDMLAATGIATLVAFVVGLLGIHLTLGLVNKYGFLPFAFYRIVFGLMLLAGFMGGALV